MAVETSRAKNETVRQAIKADSAQVSQTLARAFYDDPVFSHFLPDDSTRLKKLERVMAILFKLGLPHGACYTTTNYESITLWRPPNGWHVPFSAYIVNGPALLSTFRSEVNNPVSIFYDFRIMLDDDERIVMLQ